MRWLLWPLVLCCAGCAVTYPKGWESRDPSAEIPVYGAGDLLSGAGPSWTFKDGARLSIDVESTEVLRGMGLYRQDIRFSLGYVGDEASRVRCESEPEGPGVPSSPFGCWTEGSSGQQARFLMSPGRGCSLKDLDTVETLTTPDCWEGELLFADAKVRLRHGVLTSTGSPVGYVTWVDEDDQLLLAADIVGGVNVELFEPRTPPPVSPVPRRLLVLLTVALSYWEDATTPD